MRILAESPPTINRRVAHQLAQADAAAPENDSLQRWVRKFQQRTAHGSRVAR